MLQAGTIVDEQFEIVCSVGAGAQATVYRALDLNLQRTVALKLMHIDDDQILNSEQRFQREARLVSLLHHPNILQSYKFGKWQGSFYTCVDFFDGIPLTDLLRGGPMPWRRAIKLCLEVAKGMQHAHAQGVVHRDLTPRNIMLSRGTGDIDQVKVVDFGLAKWLGSDAAFQKLTQTGDVVGSLYCMSPEQCSGKEADSRSDVYALGCVLYNCLTGEPCFMAMEAIVMMHKHLNEQAPPASALAELGCPAVVDKVVAKAMSKSPADRYHSMAEFASDLEALLAGKEPDAATVAFASGNQSGRNNRVMVSLLVGGIILLSAITFKTQIICSLLSSLDPVKACSIAAYLVQGKTPLSQADRNEIAIHAADIAEDVHLCSPDAVILYARSDRGRAANDGGKDKSNGSVMALKTLLALAKSHGAPAATEFNRLAALSLAEIPSNCRNREVGRLCFEIVPKVDDSLREKFVHKGLDIVDTTRDQGAFSLIGLLFDYSRYFDATVPANLRAGMAERCVKALGSVSTSQPGRAIACCRTAMVLEDDDPRRLPLILESARLSGRPGEYHPADLPGTRNLLSMLYADASWYQAYSFAKRNQPDQAFSAYQSLLQHIKADPFLTPTDKASKIANTTLGAIEAIRANPARAKDVMALLDSLEDIPPSMKDFCFWRDSIRNHMLRDGGHYAQCQTLLDGMLVRYPADFDAARTWRGLGHLKVSEGKFDEGIAAYKESLKAFANCVSPATLLNFEFELTDSRRSLEYAEKRKLLADAEKRKNSESPR